MGKDSFLLDTPITFYILLMFLDGVRSISLDISQSVCIEKNKLNQMLQLVGYKRTHNEHIKEHIKGYINQPFCTKQILESNYFLITTILFIKSLCIQLYLLNFILN